MRNLINFFENIKPFKFQKVITAIGVFDGVHLGHREIIRRAVLRAREKNMPVLVLSFSPHPRQLLRPADPPKLLMPESERIRLLHEAGADVRAFINFPLETANMEPDEFLRRRREESACEIAGICVGSNWKFGRNGRGNREVLAEFCRKEKWSFDAVDELEFRGRTISSTAIRQAIAQGDLTSAGEMSGRAATLYGVVEKGFHIAGESLSAPTANLAVSAGILPPDGVYSGSVEIGREVFPAAVNIGVAPTFGNGLRRVEIHLIGFSGNLYGAELSVALYRFLRPEKRFDSPEKLKEQIAADIKSIKNDHLNRLQSM